MEVSEISCYFETELYELYCPYCGTWVCDTDLQIGRIIQLCREHNCKKRLVILNEGEGPFIFKDRRKKARVRVKLRKK